MDKFKGALAVFIGAASFGILSTFVKKAYAAGFDLGEVTGVQALLGMLFLWLLHFIIGGNKDKTQYPQLSKKWKILVSGISTGAVSILYYKSVELVPASIAIVLLMQFIWISALINYIVFKQKPTKWESIGIICILASTFLATGAFEDSFSSISPLGIMFGMLAATAYAIFIIVNGKVGNDYPPVVKSALMVTGACIFIFITLQPFSLFDINNDLGIYKYGLILSLFGTVLPPFLFAYGMPKTGVSLGSILSAVELPVAVCLSFFVLHEPVSILQWVGVLLILFFVVLINSIKKNSN
ncbi:EamA family transporter [Sphingobacterium rhinopitheci]|uniref:EamA family transporter n=1 Tax=Sphingobacterium rhinopitheci TaxID=2781960 RepID=UPI001F520460|nr:EamA family transporter [Sphingobacterium rhinopitheci]MCI0920725.1 EamA family transporter [Sphingobacterium rhinopitheci]